VSFGIQFSAKRFYCTCGLHVMYD